MLKTSLAVKVAATLLTTFAVAGGGIALAAQSGEHAPGDAPVATPTSHESQGNDCESNDDHDAMRNAEPTDSPRASETKQEGDERNAEPTATSTDEAQATTADDDDESVDQGDACSENGEDADGATPTHDESSEEPEDRSSDMPESQDTPDATRSGGHD